MNKFFLIAFFIFATTSIFAECKTSNVYDDITCYEKQLKKNKARLNQIYKTLFYSMDKEGQKLFEKSQSNWLLYKNSHCDEVVAYQSRESLGAGTKLINLSCNSQLIDERIKQLRVLKE